MTPRYGCLFLAMLMLVAATPAANATEPGTCVGMDVSRVGQGIGVYFIETSNVYAVQLASGVPERGFTLTLLIGPTLCLGPSHPIGGLPPMPELGQSAPGLPILP